MNKKIIIGVVTLLVLVGGGVYFVSSNKNSSSNKTSESSTDAGNVSKVDDKSVTSESTTQTTNAETLAKSGKAQHCTFSYDGATGKADGNMYTDGKGKSRMSMNTIQTAQGNSGANDMIIRDNKYYSWITTAGQTIGFSGDLGSQSTSNTNSSTTAPNKDFSMKCTGWTVDNSKFELPTGVNFTTLNLNTAIPAR